MGSKEGSCNIFKRVELQNFRDSQVTKLQYRKKSNLMIQPVISSLENAEEKMSQKPQPFRALKIRKRTLISLN